MPKHVLKKNIIGNKPYFYEIDWCLVLKLTLKDIKIYNFLINQYFEKYLNIKAMNIIAVLTRNSSLKIKYEYMVFHAWNTHVERQKEKNKSFFY